MWQQRLRGLLLAGACSISAVAEPIRVHHVEGSARGFLVLRDAAGHRIAHGDLTQTVHGARVTSRLTFRFSDGSLDDDITVYTQKGTFLLLTDHHVQKGPSFPKPVDSRVDVTSGIVTSRSVDASGKEHVDTQHLEMPPDISNGMALTLIGNIGFHVPQTRLAYVAADSKRARLVHLLVSPVGEEPIIVAGARYHAMNFLVRVQIGGVAGIIAPLIGKQPDDLHVWIVDGLVPLVVAEEGQLYEGGPVWRIELAVPTWTH